MGITADIHMDKWNRDIPDVKRTVEELWPSKCSKKKWCLRIVTILMVKESIQYKLLNTNLPGLDDVLRAPTAIHIS